jgi:hypothetical protein
MECAVLTRCTRYFPTVYEPTVFENYVHGTCRQDAHCDGSRLGGFG